MFQILIQAARQGSLIPPMVGGKLDFQKNFPPMGESLGGKFFPPWVGWVMTTLEPLDPCAISGSGSVLRGCGASASPLTSELRQVGTNWINPAENNSIEVT